MILCMIYLENYLMDCYMLWWSWSPRMTPNDFSRVVYNECAAALITDICSFVHKNPQHKNVLLNMREQFVGDGGLRCYEFLKLVARAALLSPSSFPPPSFSTLFILPRTSCMLTNSPAPTAAKHSLSGANIYRSCHYRSGGTRFVI